MGTRHGSDASPRGAQLHPSADRLRGSQSAVKVTKKGEQGTKKGEQEKHYSEEGDRSWEEGVGFKRRRGEGPQEKSSEVPEPAGLEGAQEARGDQGWVPRTRRRGRRPPAAPRVRAHLRGDSRGDGVS